MDNPVDIVTLENLPQKLPRWDPLDANQLYALVDMGSNGIRFSISDLSPPHARHVKCVYAERAGISLFDALNASSSSGSGPNALVFPGDTVRLVSQTLARFRSIAVDEFGVPPHRVMVFATEAMRRAQNASAMLEAIRTEAPGLVVHILAPQVETLFGAVGARSGFVDAKGLFLDLGGGSVQMTYMDTYATRAIAVDSSHPGYEVAAAMAGQSLPFGAARLYGILQNANAAVQKSEIATLRGGLEEAFRTLCGRFPSLAATMTEIQEMDSGDDTGIDIFLCGGGFRGYGSMLMHHDPVQPYPIPSIGSYTVSGKLFRKTEQMLKANKSFDGKIFGMSKRRRAQFPAIVAVVDALIAAVPRIRSVTFCAGGNREGALMMMLPREIRESSPLTVVDPKPNGLSRLPSSHDPASVQAVLATLLAAFPPNLPVADEATVFGLGLGQAYVTKIWARLGEDSEANASAALHDAVSCPSSPGLTHLARAVLGLTLCARWGGRLGPADKQLHDSLRDLVERFNPDALFWADYIGAVTAVLAKVVRNVPMDEGMIKRRIRLQSTSKVGKKLKISLEITLGQEAAKGVDLEEFAEYFKPLNKSMHGKKEVAVTATTFS